MFDRPKAIADQRPRSSPHSVSPSARVDRRPYYLTNLFLILITLAVFGQVVTHGFVDFDDDLYVTDNRHVQAGLTAGNLLWAFTSTAAFNRHPVTGISHLADVSLFGMNTRGHHLTNLLLHIGNVLLVFSALRSR